MKKISYIKKKWHDDTRCGVRAKKNSRPFMAYEGPVKPGENENINIAWRAKTPLQHVWSYLKTIITSEHNRIGWWGEYPQIVINSEMTGPAIQRNVRDKQGNILIPHSVELNFIKHYGQPKKFVRFDLFKKYDRHPDLSIWRSNSSALIGSTFETCIHAPRSFFIETKTLSPTLVFIKQTTKMNIDTKTLKMVIRELIQESAK